MSLFNEAKQKRNPALRNQEFSVKPHKLKKKVGHRELLAKLPHRKIVRRTGNDGLPGMWRLHHSPVGENFIRSEVVYIATRVEVKDLS